MGAALVAAADVCAGSSWAQGAVQVSRRAANVLRFRKRHARLRRCVRAVESFYKLLRLEQMNLNLILEPETVHLAVRELLAKASPEEWELVVRAAVLVLALQEEVRRESRVLVRSDLHQTQVEVAGRPFVLVEN